MTRTQNTLTIGPRDLLEPEAAARIASLFARLDAIKHACESLAARRRAPSADLAAINRAEARLNAEREDILFTLELGLGKHPNEAARDIASLWPTWDLPDVASTDAVPANVVPPRPVSHDDARDLTASQAARRLNLLRPDGKTPLDRLYTLARSGKLGGYQLGRTWRFPPEGIDNYRSKGARP